MSVFKKYQFLLASITFVLLISVMTFTLISFGPSTNTHSVTSGSVDNNECTGPEHASGENDTKILVTNANKNNDDEHKRSSEQSTANNRLSLQEILVIACGLQNQNICGSCVITGFPDKHVIKIFFGLEPGKDAKFFESAFNFINSKQEFSTSEIAAELVKAVKTDGIDVDHSEDNEEVNEQIKNSTFSKYFNSIFVENTKKSYLAIISGSANELKDYELEPAKMIRGKNIFLSKYNRHFGYCDISGFKRGEEIKRIFMSVINIHKFGEICDSFNNVTPDAFDNLIKQSNLGEMQTIQSDDGLGVKFDCTVKGSSGRDHKLSNIKNKGFISFFQNLKGSLGDQDFFVILTGSEKALKPYTLDGPIKK